VIAFSFNREGWLRSRINPAVHSYSAICIPYRAVKLFFRALGLLNLNRRKNDDSDNESNHDQGDD